MVHCSDLESTAAMCHLKKTSSLVIGNKEADSGSSDDVRPSPVQRDVAGSYQRNSPANLRHHHPPPDQKAPSPPVEPSSPAERESSDAEGSTVKAKHQYLPPAFSFGKERDGIAAPSPYTDFVPLNRERRAKSLDKDHDNNGAAKEKDSNVGRNAAHSYVNMIKTNQPKSHPYVNVSKSDSIDSRKQPHSRSNPANYVNVARNRIERVHSDPKNAHFSEVKTRMERVHSSPSASPVYEEPQKHQQKVLKVSPLSSSCMTAGGRTEKTVRPLPGSCAELRSNSLQDDVFGDN